MTNMEAIDSWFPFDFFFLVLSGVLALYYRWSSNNTRDRSMTESISRNENFQEKMKNQTINSYFQNSKFKIQNW